MKPTDESIPFEQTPEALRQRFAQVDPNWNRRPESLESREAARKRIESKSWSGAHEGKAA